MGSVGRIEDSDIAMHSGEVIFKDIKYWRLFSFLN